MANGAFTVPRFTAFIGCSLVNVVECDRPGSYGSVFLELDTARISCTRLDRHDSAIHLPTHPLIRRANQEVTDVKRCHIVIHCFQIAQSEELSNFSSAMRDSFSRER